MSENNLISTLLTPADSLAVKMHIKMFSFWFTLKVQQFCCFVKIIADNIEDFVLFHLASNSEIKSCGAHNWVPEFCYWKCRNLVVFLENNRGRWNFLFFPIFGQ